jgi:hypothetical protein
MHTRECQRQTLARSGFAVVELCNCGAVHLTMGAVTLRLAPEAMPELAQVMGEAARELALQEAVAEYTSLRAEAVS